MLIGAAAARPTGPICARNTGSPTAQLRPYNFNMAPFLADKKAIQQGFLSSEPYSIAQALGRPPRCC